MAVLLACWIGACDLSSSPPDGARAAVGGVIRYEGPRPRCVGEEIQGQFVFQLFPGSGPSPFEVVGPATERLLLAGRAFDSGDCEPGVSPISKDVDFELRSFGPSGLLEETPFHLVVFFDATGDYQSGDAFLGQPNRGDVFGAAYESPETRRFEIFRFGPTSLFPSGQTFAEVEVTVDAVVRSEVPAFRYGSGLKEISSEATLPPASVEGEAWEDALFAVADATLEVLPVATEPHRSALSTVGIGLSDDPARGFWSVEVDPERMFGELAHPILGELTWRTPFTVLRRRRSDLEQQVGIPEVLLVPLPRPSLETKQVFSPSMELLIPPVAIVDLNPALPVCRVPYIAPGNEADRYEGTPTECQELPTGTYDGLVTHGVAGGSATSGVPSFISDTGLRVVGGEFVAQRWSVPNALGQLLNDQGEASQVTVVEGDPVTAPDPMQATPDHGEARCQQAPDPAQPGSTRSVVLTPVPPACCEPVQDLCDLPLCAGDASDGTGIRRVTMIDRGRPDCVPFLMPQSCCPS